MFEAAETGKKLSKEAFKKQSPKVRSALLNAQLALKESGFSVVIIISGVEGAGKSHTVNLLLEWMDPRGIKVNAMWDPTEEERDHPRFWRFWRKLPPNKKTGIFFGSWYTEPIVSRAFKTIGTVKFDYEMGRIVNFERMIVKDSVLLLKFWLHISKKEQRRRFEKLEKDPDTRWRVTKKDWKFHKKYDRFRKISEQALSLTNTADAPWHIIDASDEQYRNLTIAKIVLEKLKERLALQKQQSPRKPQKPEPLVPKKSNMISKLDLKQKISEKQYESLLEKYQGQMTYLSRKLYESGRSMVIVFEGMDAAGKGGTIRRLVRTVDPRIYHVIPVAAPTEEEREFPYLWRFWRYIPGCGQLTVFDRSWYGRVLVERVEGFCAKEDWLRAYSEINDFEKQLTDSGMVVLKFWMALGKNEQMRRFKEREEIPWKQYKITEEDWRNREKWDAYVAAACDMIEKTSAPDAPWVLVASDNKHAARIQVLKTVVKTLEKTL